jgi:hypothetical protein
LLRPRRRALITFGSQLATHFRCQLIDLTAGNGQLSDYLKRDGRLLKTMAYGGHVENAM